MKEYVVGGVLFSPILIQLSLALLLTLLVSFLLLRLNFYKWVWHRPLVEVAIFVILLGALVFLTPGNYTPLAAPNVTRETPVR